MSKSQQRRGELSQKTRLEHTQSQRSNRGEMSFSQKTRADDMTEEQLEAAIQNVTAFLLCDMRIKRKLRKEDIVTNALNKSAKQYGTIMKRVKDNLASVFGLLMAKLPDSDDVFIIVNKHRAKFEEITLQQSSEEEIQDNLILTVVLSSIFMNRGQMFESHVFTILETIGFLNDTFYGSTRLGKMKDYVTKLVKNVFVKQLYLEARSIPRPEKAVNPPLPECQSQKVTVFEWGYRALLEVDVDKIVDHLIKIHEGNKPAAFPATYFKELKLKQTTIRAQVFAG